MRHALLLPILAISIRAFGATAPDPGGPALEDAFQRQVRPFVTNYCISCHGLEKTKGDLDLSEDSTMQRVAKEAHRWERIIERLQADEMPPEKAKQHPTPEARRQVIEWIRAMRIHEANRDPGDPGPVFARRLSNAEYDYTLRDLTGVDIHPAREFPVDPANEAGFDNSAESLTMSPALVKKYLEAARDVSDHLVLKPNGFEFAPHPVVADTDRDKYCVNRIIHSYQRQRTDYSEYFMAAWRFENRAALGKSGQTLADIAAEAGISPRYLATIWATLTEPAGDVGPIAALHLHDPPLDCEGPARKRRHASHSNTTAQAS